ncbi:MAG TPA: hypothetical protein VKT49_12940 [Bryobacteraceae bacterium]|nr:hypothetical protein [Bryobacteraceae bacterium]
MGRRIGYCAVTLILALPLVAQPPRGGRGPARPAKAVAPIDLTGYWVSIVDEDWRFRMVMPPPGDYMGVPMNAASKQVADAWDPAKDEAAGEQCKAYGAPALLRVPEHLHFTWQDDQTLKLETDAGEQTRLFHFGDWKPAGGPATWQGDSVAEWEITGGGRGPAAANPDAPPTGKGTLKVMTTHLKAGYLRKNGVPYSENAELTEYYDMIKERNGDTMLVVTIVTNDPKYLREPFIITSHFKKQAGADGWKPTPCSSRW